MIEIDFYKVDAFTQAALAGNPAGVAFPQDVLTGAQMQSVAGQLGLETAFVTADESGEVDFRIAYYTGLARVPLCGHDTVAAVTVLRQRGQVHAPGQVRLATDVGTLAVTINEAGEVVMEQALPSYGAEIDPAEVMQALGLKAGERPFPAQVVSTGTPFLLVFADNPEGVDSLTPDMGRLTAALPPEVAGVYVWTWNKPGSDALVYARCFAPGIGLPEDPVTGTASGALGAYLARHRPDLIDANGLLEFETQQGTAMGRPGSACVRVQTSRDRLMSVEVSGYALVVGQGTLTV